MASEDDRMDLVTNYARNVIRIFSNFKNNCLFSIIVYAIICIIIIYSVSVIKKYT